MTAASRGRLFRRVVVLAVTMLVGLGLGAVAGLALLGWGFLNFSGNGDAPRLVTAATARQPTAMIPASPTPALSPTLIQSATASVNAGRPTPALAAATTPASTARPTPAATGAVLSGAVRSTTVPALSPTSTSTSATSPPSRQPPPTPAAFAARPDWAASLTLEQKVGQMVMFGFDGTDGNGVIATLIQQGHAGNVVLLGQNVHDPLQLRELTDNLQQQARTANGVGMLVAVDQEGGDVRRLRPPFFSDLPSARQMAAGTPGQVLSLGRRTAQEMRNAGINLDLAPVFDVNDNQANPVIGDRAFGVEPGTVSVFAGAFMEGLQAGGGAATAKHFPGHGNTSQDSHQTLPSVNKSDAALRATELPPFIDAARAGVNAIMLAHVVYPAWDPDRPASLSPAIVSGILRGELDYQGVVMTDDMNMAAIRQRWGSSEAAVMAVEAGVDLLLVAGPPDAQAVTIDAVIEAVRSGRIPESRIDASVSRILALKRKLGL